jgi:hypothetical protein
MRKSKTNSMQKFAEKCIQDSMKLFSRSWSANANLLLVQTQNRANDTKIKNEKEDKSQEEKSSQM